MHLKRDTVTREPGRFKRHGMNVQGLMPVSVAGLPLTRKTNMHVEPVFHIAWCCQPHRMEHGKHRDLKMDIYDGLTHYGQHFSNPFIKYTKRGVWHPVNHCNRIIVVDVVYIFTYFNDNEFHFRVKEPKIIPGCKFHHKYKEIFHLLSTTFNCFIYIKII